MNRGEPGERGSRAAIPVWSLKLDILISLLFLYLCDAWPYYMCDISTFSINTLLPFLLMHLLICLLARAVTHLVLDVMRRHLHPIYECVYFLFRSLRSRRKGHILILSRRKWSHFDFVTKEGSHFDFVSKEVVTF
ncbi:hypothetical protein X798_00047 [Onchocerca flexuosa]|uniref:Transmembrane protein n=2 Tax=Onchocerca flexuosa TaxID=387005 RepID=A0A183H4L5_9BILA|nr:hypothetical protein X798_00047 [Onchocerca flexuosa]VDO32934.1 unnamed protein product [Onchocerca flexuosa]